MPGRRQRKHGNTQAARNAALQGRPHQVPPVRQETKDGKLYVTVTFERPRWQRLLGGERLSERTFGLDRYGQRVYASCDGKRTVRQVIKHFATKARVSVPEAEMAVTKFLRTLLSKGLIVMEMDKERK